MSDMTMVGAINAALARAMADDPTVLVLGQDVGRDGGVFRATDGLLGRFGETRVIDMPLAESAIAGLAVGLAAQHFRPVAEIQFSGFIYPTIDQMANHASRLRNRTRGRLSCPMVLRAPNGGGIRAAEHHSESVEAFFINIPGLRVVVPSSPAKAYGLLLAAIGDDDPVVFLEPTRLYRAIREQVVDDGRALPLDRSFVVRDGADVTLVTWGGTMVDCLAAADSLAAEGVAAAVIDVASLKPIDMAPILTSLEQTGRCVIVHEAPLTGGPGAEIAARIAEGGLMSLRSPVQRVTGFDTVMPLPRLERAWLPTTERIVAAALATMEFQ